MDCWLRFCFYCPRTAGLREKAILNGKCVPVFLCDLCSALVSVAPPLWSSGQSSLLQIQGSRVRFPGTTKKKVVGLERGPFSLVSTTEELLDRKVAAPV
jgi:hypothetical protein